MKNQINLSSLSKETQAAIRKELAGAKPLSEFLEEVRELLIRGEYSEAQERIKARKAIPRNKGEKGLRTSRGLQDLRKELLDIYSKEGMEGVKKYVTSTGFKLSTQNIATEELRQILTKDAIKRDSQVDIDWLDKHKGLELPRPEFGYSKAEKDLWNQVAEKVREKADRNFLIEAYRINIEENDLDEAKKMLHHVRDFYDAWTMTAELQIIEELLYANSPTTLEKIAKTLSKDVNLQAALLKYISSKKDKPYWETEYNRALQIEKFLKL